MSNIAICRREGLPDFTIDLDMRGGEDLLHAYQQSGNYKCFDEAGNLLEAPELEIHPPKGIGLFFSAKVRQ